MSTSTEQTYTFLFTDIEGSTRLWSRAPIAMAAAVQQQETILRQTVANLGGTVFKTVGDGTYAVFPSAPPAVQAAVAAQRALTATIWDGFEEPSPLRVRMGLHTGVADERAGDYFGPTLNCLSRMLAAANGGQILCTGDVPAACGPDWPDGIDLRDLGERTLRDVPGNVRIFQLVAPGLPEHFPPLATLDTRIHNLPRWPSPMVDRESESSRLRAVLRSHEVRMVTVLGTGGVGKTRLTTEVAAQLLDEYQDGIRFVDLSPLRDDTQVLPATLHVVGASDHMHTPKDALLDWLRDRELLLVLDNCEQVVEGVAELCSQIVQSVDDITILATSRVPIRIRGERQIALEPLPVAVGASGSAAANLFAERAREVNETFALDQDSLGDVVQICRIVDGLPLAIELAAASVRVLSPSVLRQRLQESRALLRDGARDLPDRQRTLTTTIAWSYDLLSPKDQRAFRRLAVFRGGIALDAATAVIANQPEDPLSTLSRLDALVQANLLQVIPVSSGEPRFLMLQTIREFAVGVLQNAGEWEDAASAHARFFSDLVDQSRPHLRAGDARPWLDRLELDLENLRAAIEFEAGRPAMHQGALNMVIALSDFLAQRCTVTQWRTWLELTYRDDDSLAADLRIDALWSLGNTWFGQPAVAAEYYRKAIAIADAEGNERKRIKPVASLSAIAALGGDYDTAEAMAQSVLAYGQRTNDVQTLCLGSYRVAYAASEAGHLSAALDATARMRHYARELGDTDFEAWSWLIEGRTHRRLGQIDLATQAIDRAFDRFSEVGHEEAVGLCHLERGLAMLGHDMSSARASIEAAITALKDCADTYTIISLIEGVARLLIASDEAAKATELLGTARQLRDTSGIVVAASDARFLQESSDRARQTLGATTFERIVERGRLNSPRVALDRYQAVGV